MAASAANRITDSSAQTHGPMRMRAQQRVFAARPLIGGNSTWADVSVSSRRHPGRGMRKLVPSDLRRSVLVCEADLSFEHGYFTVPSRAEHHGTVSF